MSDAEKIARSVERYFEVDDEEMVSNLTEDIEAYTSQTLQELRKKVDGQQYDSDWGSEDAEYYRGYNDAIKEIVSLIDEAINE